MWASWPIQPGQSLTSRPERNFAHNEVTSYVEPKGRRIIGHNGLWLYTMIESQRQSERWDALQRKSWVDREKCFDFSLFIGVRGIEVPHMVKYCGTLETERQEKQRKQIKPK